MLLSRVIPRKLSAGALCCLLVVGGLPRAWCLCPDAACRAACEAGACPLAAQATDPLHAEHTTCPHCARLSSDKPVADGDAAGFSASDCHCQIQVAQVVLSSLARDLEVPRASIDWLALADGERLLGRPAEHASGDVLLRLPPDDPVSRAQILRL